MYCLAASIPKSEMTPVADHKPPSKWETYAFVIPIILSIGLLMVGSAGLAGYFHIGELRDLPQIHAIIMMASGYGGGLAFLIMGAIAKVKNQKITHSDQVPLLKNKHKIRQKTFITMTDKGKISFDDDNRFGKKEWEKYFGPVGDEPEIPENVKERRNHPCPFAEDETIQVKDTHMLVLVPETVNGKNLTLNYLKELIQNPKLGGHKRDYGFFGATTKQKYGETKVEQSHWVLMPKYAISQCANMTYQEQESYVAQYGYQIPTVLQLAICLSMEYVSSGEEQLKTIPQRLVRCSNPLGNYFTAIQGFGSAPLEISCVGSGKDPLCSVAAILKC
jgi:hypothetical protein